METWFEVFITVFATYGLFSALIDILLYFFDRKKGKLYIYLTPDRVNRGEWDVAVSSPEEDIIMELLREKYGKIYIRYGDGQWTENTENSSKEQ